ncbi:uncharacterized protein [Branchiostoma lanceolatum]|uniref:uncharacterized protein n=1 Tax=Branchiostoma lanceolatum TaxID=7740 RepID=UPI0034572055
MKFLIIFAVLLCFVLQCEAQTTDVGTTMGTASTLLTTAGGATTDATALTTPATAAVATTPTGGIATAASGMPTAAASPVMTTVSGGLRTTTAGMTGQSSTGSIVSSSVGGTPDASNVTSVTSTVTGKDPTTPAVVPTVCTKECVDHENKTCTEGVDANCTCANETCSEVQTPSPQSGGLSGGQVAGIAVGAVAGVVVIGAVAAALLTCKKKKGGRAVSPSSRTAIVEEGDKESNS